MRIYSTGNNHYDGLVNSVVHIKIDSSKNKESREVECNHNETF